MSVLRKFHIADLVSVTSGILIPSPGRKYAIEGICDILNYMTGENLQTAALPRAANECTPYLFEQHSFLKKIVIPNDGSMKDERSRQVFLDGIILLYGEYHAVRPIHPEDHEILDPVEDIRRLGGNPARIIKIDPNEEK